LPSIFCYFFVTKTQINFVVSTIYTFRWCYFVTSYFFKKGEENKEEGEKRIERGSFLCKFEVTK